MKTTDGVLREIWLDQPSNEETTPSQFPRSGTVHCPSSIVPAPGQYLLAQAPADPLTFLPVPLFFAHAAPNGFRCAPALPDSWQPGMVLRLRGPLGHGFTLPRELRRLGLLALGETPLRLLALADLVLRQGGDAALLSTAPLAAHHALPAALEIFPPDDIAGLLAWANFLAVDLSPADLPGLRARLKLPSGARLSIPAQALVHTAMPCGGSAECGACAVGLRRRAYALACKDGPVFDLNELEW
jgi:hypothetical protein